ncbi:MAG: lysophospholipase [Candidatus Omnitrophica bacterium]|nr:lysophospholipase [Candidatus Omnitrophota bacterium]
MKTESSDLIFDTQSNLFYRRWLTEKSQACLLLVHGLFAHSGRWQPLAEYFLNKGVSSYALDLEGFGATKGRRGDIESFEVYFEQIRQLQKIIATCMQQLPTFLVGESFGGLLAYLFSYRYARLFKGLICLSPAFSVKLQISWWEYTRVFLHFFINPQRQFRLRLAGDMCTRDPEFQEQIDNDILGHNFISARFVLNYFTAERTARNSVFVIPIPVLFLIAGNDRIIDPHFSKIVFYRLVCEDKQMIKYPEMYHALSVEYGKEKVFEDIWQWIKKHIN